jgi:hypothetical protein
MERVPITPAAGQLKVFLSLVVEARLAEPHLYLWSCEISDGGACE